MDNELIKKGLVSIGLLMFLPLILVYVSVLDSMALWLYAWVIPFCIIVFSKIGDLITKGLLVISYSVLICSIGSEFIIKEQPELEQAVINLSLMITLLAGGLGGNLMSHDLINQHYEKEKG